MGDQANRVALMGCLNSLCHIRHNADKTGLFDHAQTSHTVGCVAMLYEEGNVIRRTEKLAATLCQDLGLSRKGVALAYQCIMYLVRVLQLQARHLLCNLLHCV